jgi:hypothetical protein
MNLDCTCENEAKILYEMYKFQNNLNDGVWETKTCCNEGLATMTISGKTLTLVYADGKISTHTEA